ncbi:hypothetical protein HN807_07600 [Candidatus Bathyarchaeota archaeon]|mgnify:CR=1 FL=1|jgi:sulfofructose kinase|nr:hypothetical protein [Candidatus Bathyarchaeota archaeon]MBT4319560.1 hypothetical protein [Candidatus Bathyarchaeota archaeon]MBT4422972.1 hypothetical protein [Candidatus Bathyarchaeota archaeon]MBT6604486.1 hypothetical protein [Candidatus Bathyarchaeota archaeon]MBT7187301.1 hypothetical protein [Candidatus Bathyarchaeota archaeon]
MGQPEIIGLGLSTLDVLFRLEDMPTWEAGVVVDEFGIDGGGPAGTGVSASCKLGASVGFIGLYGTDWAGELKLRSLNDAGVDTSKMLVREGPERNVVLVCVNSESGERVFSWEKGNLSDPLRVEELDKDYITSADFLHLDGTYPEAAAQAARWMREAGKTVMLDGSKTSEPISETIRNLVPLVDLLICGSGFSYQLTGIEDVYEAGEAVLDLGPRVFVQTEGENGSYTVTKDDLFHIPAYDVDVVDTTGAGDVFHGAYLFGLLKGWDIKTITLFSTAVSALKCTKLGGRRSIPEFNEVTAFLKDRGMSLDSI